MPASRARSKTRRASSSEDVTPFKLVCDAPNVIAPSESALTRNPEVPSLRNSTDRSPEVNCRRIRYRQICLFESERLSPSQIVLADPRRADALADGTQDSTADRRADRADRRLAQFGEAVMVGQAAEMDIHLRRVTSAQDRILVQIALDHPPILDVDLFVQRHVEPEDYPALDQVQHRVAIDNTTAIERRVQLMDFQYATFGHLDRGDDADRRAGLGLAVHATIGDRDPLPHAFGQALAPARLVGNFM